jgi:hypothetical protein
MVRRTFIFVFLPLSASLLLIGFRAKWPWSVETAALGVICARGNLYITVSTILADRSAGGRTTRKRQQSDCRHNQ